MKEGAWFPYLLMGLLLTSVGANIYLIVRATQDPSFAVEPDYYEKAVEWDRHQQEQAESDALGWQIVVEAQREQLRVRLRDALGRSIDGAEVEVVAFHNARAADRLTGRMIPRGQGLYTWDQAFDRPGLWEYRLAAVLAEDRFVHVTQEELR